MKADERDVQILDERARRLALAEETAASRAEQVEVLTFCLSKERYAIEMRYVLEVVKFANLTPAPGGTSFFRGFTNLRGEILAVFDLRELLGVHGRPISDLFRIIVVGDDRAEFGMLADLVEEAVTLPISELVSSTEATTGKDFVRGLTKDALILLDGGALLTDSRLYVDDRVVGDEGERPRRHEGTADLDKG